ncbi:2-C-methyl-D-erythritol 4-phosphate cytidylyltransferase [Cohnella fermenti]|uniref:2-C-methyl-D-erythritol 4-phosphate cytidylyltransferase n=1 Tax=Cohnella fermenti TaxID=2565925 RepID=A0A4S4BVE9_9BACL|nr:2-C-methyl-D-erythritol 4-phosphate cytidylyltransferase [Cohnella fermenti]THF79074.1 2-C-methyl-D-erythritol 4-phosphate cytidylyltransferase [Cohnella fermenti]
MEWGAVIVAAGRGKRMAAADNKVYLPLGDRPVLAHTIEAFERCAAVSRIVLVTAPGEEARAETVLRELGASKVSAIVPGGAERQDSVYAGLAALGTEGALVHDAARPLVAPEQIEACCREAERHGAAALAVPVKDTIKIEGEKGFMTQTPDRSTLWSVQTPQAFLRADLMRAHRLAKEAGKSATDDTMLMELLGRKVAIVQGDYRNLKITTPEDLPVAELFLASRRRED